MAKKTLAVVYRPKTFDEVVEQDVVKAILKEQISTGTFKNAYLFCGPAGCAKTTLGRILANEINHGKGLPIEVDAASNSGVENVRNIIDGARKRALDAEYKVYILDEVHSFSNSAWQALLKLLEEPPANTIFIMCTTDPQKIPGTILSRVQRYNLSKISLKGISSRLNWIMAAENLNDYPQESIEYIAKLAEGGMRDAITMLDKCLSISPKLELSEVCKALGTVDYRVYFDFLMNMESKTFDSCIRIIEDAYNSGKDLKQFMQGFEVFCLDVCKYKRLKDFTYIRIPNLPEYKKLLGDETYEDALRVLRWCHDLNSKIKYDPNARSSIEAGIVLFGE